jgi:hypothetical protein
MAANNAPIYSRAGAISLGQAITLAANDYTGTGANNVIIFTADATNGSFLQRVRCKAAGSNVASVLRIFINNGSTVGTGTNNTLIGEISLPATTASASTATADVDYPLGFAIPAGYRVVVGLGTAVSAGWVANVIAGNY